MNFGLRFVPAGRSIVLAYTTSLWLVPLALMSGERIGPWRAAGVVLDLAGVALLCNPLALDWTNGDVVAGNVFLSLAALSWALAIFHARRHAWRLSPLEVLPWQFLVPAVLLTVMALLSEPSSGLATEGRGIVPLIYFGPIAASAAIWAAISVARAAHAHHLARLSGRAGARHDRLDPPARRDDIGRFGRWCGTYLDECRQCRRGQCATLSAEQPNPTAFSLSMCSTLVFVPTRRGVPPLHSAPMRTLYHLWLSPFSRKVRVALREKKLDFEMKIEKVWERRPDFLALNPTGQVPVFVDEDGTAIADSGAICEYLEEVYPEPVLFGTTPRARAEVRRLIAWFDLKFARDVTANLVGEKMMKRLMARGEPSSAAIRAGLRNIHEHLDYIGYLADRRNWLAGDEFSMADIAAGAHLSAVDYIGDVPWDAHARAREWYARLKSRPSFRPLLADHIPGIAPPAHYADLDF